MFCNNILVAFDGSDLSEKALGKAVQIVKSNPNISLHVIVVVNFSVIVGSDYAVSNENIFESDMKYGNELVKRVENDLGELEIPHSVTLIQGMPEIEIINFAREQGSDLIIMGSRGLTGLKELFLGSVSHYVVQHAEVPVLIVK